MSLNKDNRVLGLQDGKYITVTGSINFISTAPVTMSSTDYVAQGIYKIFEFTGDVLNLQNLTIVHEDSSRIVKDIVVKDKTILATLI